MSTILIVDDEDPIREFLLDSFTALGYETLGAPEGKEALNLIKTKRPDVIILDVQMEGMDGFEVLKRLKNNASLRDIPVVLLTSENSQEAVERGVQNLAEAYITKPFNVDELQECVVKILKTRGSS